MRKKKPIVMWALWNHGRIMGVRHSRRDTRKFADIDITGDSTVSARWLKDGYLRIGKVTIKEVR